jgi:MFS transporter, DHA2 family, multidrug resistance protein
MRFHLTTRMRLAALLGIVWSAVAIGLALDGLGLKAFWILLVVGALIDSLVLKDREHLQIPVWRLLRRGRAMRERRPRAPFQVRAGAQGVDKAARPPGIIQAGRARRQWVQRLRLGPDSVFAPRRRWWAMAAVCTAAFAGAVSLSAVAFVLLPVLQTHVPLSSLQWVVIGYAVPFGVVLTVAKSFVRAFGCRNVFVAGLVVFGLASLLASLTGSYNILTSCRVLQGIGAGLSASAGMAILAHVFTVEERPMAMAVFSAISSLAGGLAVVAGGLLIQLSGWRAIFVFDVAATAIALLITLIAVPNPPAVISVRVREFKLPALAALAFLYVSVILLLIAHTSWRSGPSVIAVLLAASLIVPIARYIFALTDTLHVRQYFSFLYSRAFIGVNFATFLLNFATVGLYVLLGFYFENVGAYSPLVTSVFLTIPIVTGMASRIVTTSLNWSVRGQIASSLILMSVALGWLSFLPVSGRDLVVLFPLALVGLAIGIATVPTMFTALSVAPEQKADLAANFFTLTRMVGAAVGVAAFISVVLVRAPSRLSHIQLPLSVRQHLATHVGIVELGYGIAAYDASRDAFVYGIQGGVRLYAVICFVGALLSYIVIPRNPLPPQRRYSTPAEAQRDPAFETALHGAAG